MRGWVLLHRMGLLPLATAVSLLVHVEGKYIPPLTCVLIAWACFWQVRVVPIEHRAGRPTRWRSSDQKQQQLPKLLESCVRQLRRGVLG